MTANTDTTTSIDGADLVELAEILEFLGDWFALGDPRNEVAKSLLRRMGEFGGYDIDDLCQDLDRLRERLDAYTGRPA